MTFGEIFWVTLRAWHSPNYTDLLLKHVCQLRKWAIIIITAVGVSCSLCRYKMGKASSRSPATNGENSVNTSSKATPLLNRSVTQNVTGYRGILKFMSALGDFMSQNRQKFGTCLLILCDFFRCMAFKTLTTWIPFIALHTFLFFPHQGRQQPMQYLNKMWLPR